MTAAKIRQDGAWVDSTLAGKVRVGGSWVDFGPDSGGGSPESLFTSQTPTLPDNTDGGTGGITTATTLVFSAAGQITHVRFYATTTASGIYTGGVWEVLTADTGTGALLSSESTAAGITGGAWNTIALDTAVTVTPNTKAYRIGLWNSDSRYVASPNFAAFAPAAAGLTNGHIHAPATGDDPVGLGSLSQGTFRDSSAFGYPANTFNNGCYFVDVVFVPD